MMIDSNVFSVYAYILLFFNRLKIYVIQIYKKNIQKRVQILIKFIYRSVRLKHFISCIDIFF